MTTAVHLVRHAKAGNRHHWEAPDHLRPLTKTGELQARALVELPDVDHSRRLLSSPYVRCRQTFEPLAEVLSLPIENADELSEGALTETAIELILSVAREGPVALCTHGDVMRSVVKQLLVEGVPLNGPLEFKKGSAWIVAVREGSFESAHYVPPFAKS
jgi:phosphohistidine phosphatase SixA